MIFIDTMASTNSHYKFDYVRREFLAKCAAGGRRQSAKRKPAKAGYHGPAFAVEDQDFNIVRFNGGMAATARQLGTSISELGDRYDGTRVRGVWGFASSSYGFMTTRGGERISASSRPACDHNKH